MNSKLFGLDIGTTSIKAASIRKDGKGYSLESFAAAPSTPKGLQSESLVDIQALADALKQMLSQANIKSSNVVLSLPESQVYTKVIEMPQLSEQELSAALKFEMEQYVPLPLDQVRTDWQIIGNNEGEKKTMDVLLIAAPLQILNKYEKVMDVINLTPEVIETEIVSVHRALMPYFVDDAASIIVHLGATTTSVSIVKKGRLKMVFSISQGGLSITRAISADLGIDINQAENYKKAYGLNRDAFEGKIGRALSPILVSIVGDIKKAMLLYREKNNNEEIKQVVLSGGTSLLPGIDVYLTNALGVQVVLGNVWNAYNIGNVPDQLQSEAVNYSVVAGLALKNVV